MNSWKVILATLVIFGAGVITGGLLVSHAVHVNARPKPPQVIPAQNLTPWQARNKDLLRRMDRELALNTEQRTNIDRILIDSQERTKGLWKPILPQMNQEMQQVHAQIRDVLSPDQQKKFDELIKSHPPKKGDDLSPQERHLRELRRATNSPALEAPVTNSAAPPL